MNLYEMLGYVINGGMATYEGAKVYVKFNEKSVGAYCLKSHKKLGTLTLNNLAFDTEWITYQPKPILSDDEKVILRNINERYKWIARDGSPMNNLFVYESEPSKREDKIMAYFSDDEHLVLDLFNHIFKSIQWEDVKPHLIKDLLK